jgi:hypothetical protein
VGRKTRKRGKMKVMKIRLNKTLNSSNTSFRCPRLAQKKIEETCKKETCVLQKKCIHQISPKSCSAMVCAWKESAVCAVVLLNLKYMSIYASCVHAYMYIYLLYICICLRALHDKMGQHTNLCAMRVKSISQTHAYVCVCVCV